MKMTPKQAADCAGVSKSTITRAIKSGKLSSTVDDDGVNQIDGSELARWAEGRGKTINLPDGAAAPPAPVRTALDEPVRTTPNDTGEARVLSVQVEQMQARIDLLMSERDDLRQRLDRSEQERSEAQTKLTALLTDQRPDSEAETLKRRRWLLWSAVAL
ncbi:helix-turn-helix domain-containing protein [Rhodobacteraceae bacterium CCMM004]|nr:helix-turn-helix domain-containing protein [Rhodobacteraceae bacterium CCMM004]